MSTHLLYQTDSYLRQFQAAVQDVLPEIPGVILDQTAFYPGGGGQPSDKGVLTWNGQHAKVIKVKKEAEGVLHILESGSPVPAVGDQVTGEVDWERRYQLMRTHSALHILCGVIYRDYGAHVTGGDMEPLQGRMDFEFETLQKELIHEIEAAVNHEVEAGHDIEVKILPRDEAFQIPDLIRTKINLLPEGIQEVRTVNIQGLDLQADGGTHVHNTREVGKIRVVDYKSKGKINKRIYIELA